MHIVSVNVAPVEDLLIEEAGAMRRVPSGIKKQAVAGAITVGPLGLAGDGQADATVHGGPNKAVYAYPQEHYAFWQTQRAAALGREETLPPGMLGENLTLRGLVEEEVWVGDQLHIGNVILQVTEPRQPCYKFAARIGFPHAVKLMIQHGLSGFYLRVLHTGSVQAGDTFTLHPGPREVSIAQINARLSKQSEA
ncbi:MAG: MOSC domain-containing protein [Burkholderiaceae bacterium]|nr:MAG: MOSC domain-containing protein [Burkholderiaceae bacterium]